MSFPDTQRVKYGKSPLQEVVCQFRFPALLKIDTEPPAAFQDAIRKIFPDYQETHELKIEFPPGVSDQIPSEIIRQAVQSTTTKNHQFSAEGGDWRVNLTRTFIALTTTKYDKWEQFRELFQVPFNALLSTYSPPHLTRIGLRYINVIKRSILGLKDMPWSDLLARHIAGIFGSEEVASQIKSAESSTEIMLSDSESIVRIITKLVKATDEDEYCFMIDSDFFNSSKTPIEGALDRMEFLHTRASRLIRWAITDRLHNAMEPSAI